MNRLHPDIRLKAASAALAFVSIVGAPCAVAALPSQQPSAPLPPVATIPAGVPEEVTALYNSVRHAADAGNSDAPLLMQEFLDRYPSSELYDEVRLMLADWHFYRGQYTLALTNYNALRNNAFSGDIREGMLYRKAYSLLKSGFYNEAARIFRALRDTPEYGAPSRFYIAYIAYVNGNYDDAYSKFREILDSGYRDAEAEYYINQIEYLRGNYQQVATTSERLLSTGGVPDELWSETMRVGALSFFKLGDKTTARNMLRQYVDKTGDGAELAAVYSLATIYFDEVDYDRALPLFSIVTDYPGNLAQSSWLYIGQIYQSKGDSQSAALAFDKAARESWDPSVAETAAYNLAVSAAEGSSLPFGDAAGEMEAFIQNYPSSPYSKSLSNYLANAYYARREYAEALRQVDRLPSTDAETRALRQKILFQLGVSEYQQNNLTGAAAHLREAAAMEGVNKDVAAQASLWLGDVCYAQNKFSDAAAAYRAAINSGSLGSNKALAYYNLGYALMKLKDYRQADTAFKGALKEKGLSPAQKTDARLREADCLYYTGKYNDALAIFREVKQKGGADGIYATVREADILGRNGHVADKISLLESLYGGNSAGVWRSTVVSRLADAYSEQGNDRKAVSLYAEMLDSDSGNGDRTQVYYSLASNASNLYDRGDRKGALEAYRRIEESGIANLYPSAVLGIVRSSDNNEEVAAYAAKAATLPGLSAEEADEARFLGARAALSLDASARRQALVTLESLAASADREWGAAAGVTLAEALLADGDRQGAEKVLLDAIDMGSDSNYWLARAYIALSDVYKAQDKLYLAKLYLETLKNNYPDKDPAIIKMINSRLNALDK